MKLLLKSPLKTLNIAAFVLLALILVAFSVRGSLASLEFGNDITKDAAAHSILADRARTIGQLQDVVKQDVDNPDKKKPVETAMILLGVLRADDAAPLLASHLLFQREDAGRGLRLHSFGEDYPAVGALVKIGVPGLDALLYQAANTEDQKDTKSLALTNFMLTQVLGKQPAIAFLTDVINQQRESKQRERLTMILTYLQKEPGGSRQNPYL